MRGSSEASSLEVSSVKVTPREEQCVCCGEVMSPHHQCKEDTSTQNFPCLECDKTFEYKRDFNMHTCDPNHQQVDLKCASRSFRCGVLMHHTENFVAFCLDCRWKGEIFCSCLTCKSQVPKYIPQKGFQRAKEGEERGRVP